MNGMKPMFITIHLCPELEKITGWGKDRSIVSTGCPFFFIFESLLVDYPKIMATYPPEAEVLGFTVNGRAPDFFAPLQEGDQLHFWIQDRTNLQ